MRRRAGPGANGDIVIGGESRDGGGEATRFPARECWSLDGPRLLTTPGYFAYLRIGDGCNNRCAYCAIPLIRGPLRSRRMENILEEARELAAGGVKELILVAQDTTLYGVDQGKRRIGGSPPSRSAAGAVQNRRYSVDSAVILLS